MSIQLMGKIEPKWITDLFTHADKHGAFVRTLLRDAARDTEFDTVWTSKDPGEKLQALDTIRDKEKRLGEFRRVTHRGRGGEISQLGIRVHHTGLQPPTWQCSVSATGPSVLQWERDR